MEQPDAYLRRMLLRVWLDERRRPWRREQASPDVPGRAGMTFDVTRRLAILARCSPSYQRAAAPSWCCGTSAT
jgi:DNA-directed RNA polymerase specialized sigma24 family protein